MDLKLTPKPDKKLVNIQNQAVRYGILMIADMIMKEMDLLGPLI